MVATGAALGLGVALVGARFLSSMLYEVTPTDPLTFLLVLVTVGGIALAACFVPAVRAGRVDPAQSLRHD